MGEKSSFPSFFATTKISGTIKLSVNILAILEYFSD